MRTMRVFVSTGIILALAVVILAQQAALKEARRELAASRQLHAQTAPRAEREVVTAAKEAPTTPAFAWQPLEADDYRQYIQNLRSVGCPEQTIRDIIIADLDRTYATRIAELTLEQKKKESYWRSYDYESGVQYRRQVTRIEDEKRAAVREFLGIDLDEEMNLRKTLVNEAEVEFAFLPPDKRVQVGEMHRKYLSRWNENQSKTEAGLISEAESQSGFAQLVQAQEAEVRNLLGPGEFEEYQMRRSDVANRLRRQLEAFEPSEEEFRKIFRVEKEFFANHAIGEDVDPASKQRHQEALLAALGKTRYAEYQKATSGAYWNLYKTVKEQNLPKSVADRVYELESGGGARLRQLNTNTSLSNEARAAALNTLREKTGHEIQTHLGEAGYQRYLSGAPIWIRPTSP